MELAGLFQLGRLEKEVSVTKDIKIKLHTLTVAEQQKAFLEILPDAVSEAARFTSLQQVLLAYATESINGEKISLEKAKEIYTNLQYPVLLSIFGAYTELTTEQDKTLEELKKK